MAGGRARVAVSILDADHSNMAYAVQRAEKEGADRFHVDVMDAHFVPNLTFGPKMIEGIRPRTQLPIDAHLMVSDPLPFIDGYLDAGCDSVTFHVEIDPAQVEPTLRRIRAAGRAPGLAVKPKTPLSALEPYRGLFDIVLVMTVEPGFGGQEFMKDVAAEKILAARQLLTHAPADGEVHVDGGVNRETAEFVGGLGVDILVVGSVLWIKGRNMGREIRLVRALADEGYQYRLNEGKPPIPRDAMVQFSQLPKHLAMRFMAEIEAGGIPVIPLRGSGQFNPDGVRDYDLLVPASVAALTEERHGAARDRYLAEAGAWRERYIAEFGIKPPETTRPQPRSSAARDRRPPAG
ncbi:MAG TPA: ribulose-phosphate 3-epimerase [Candidatus Limnocylindrales bacterium]|nr:ribulose-phosphate 3-epimerase [Candidatus Limnocylindrales bacterium]